MKFTLDSLEALDAIDRLGSFSAAARELNKAQSAISYAVKQLEQALGVELFDRHGHRAILTDAGRSVLAEGRLLLLRARRLETLADRFSDGWEPQLSVVIDGILPVQPVMRVLRQMIDEGVDTRIQLVVEFLGGVQRRFEEDRADLMLVKDFTPRDTLAAHSLAPMEVVLVAAREHPLAAMPGPLELPDLQEYVELTVFDARSNVHLFGGSRVFWLSDFNTKHQALRLALGFGWMPLGLVADDLAAGRLAELPYAPGSRFSFTPRLVHPADRPLGRAGRRFQELVQAAFEP